MTEPREPKGELLGTTGNFTAEQVPDPDLVGRALVLRVRLDVKLLIATARAVNTDDHPTPESYWTAFAAEYDRLARA